MRFFYCLIKKRIAIKLWFKKVKSEDKSHLYSEKKLTCSIPQKKQSDEYHRNVQSHHQGFVWKRLSRMTSCDSFSFLRKKPPWPEFIHCVCNVIACDRPRARVPCCCSFHVTKSDT